MKAVLYSLIFASLLVCGCESDSKGSYDTGGGGRGQSGGPTASQSSSSTATTTLNIDAPPVNIRQVNVHQQSSP
jgi:hypothetical protein